MAAHMRTGAHGTGERIRRRYSSRTNGGSSEEEGRVRLGRLARSTSAPLGTSSSAHHRTDPDAGQPVGGSRPSGIVQVPHRRRGREESDRSAADDRAGGGNRHARPGGHVICVVADPRRGRAARDHRHAQTCAGANHAPAGSLLRFDADRRAGGEDHVGRRRHQEPGRHGSGAAHWRTRHCGARPRRAVLAELAPDGHHHPRARGVWWRYGVRLPHAASALP